MRAPIPKELRIPANRELLAYLAETSSSAHGDLVELVEALLPAGRAELSFCPAPEEFAYVAYYDQDHRIYGLVEGMQCVSLRLPTDFHAIATKNGGLSCEGFDSNWLEFAVQWDPTAKQRLGRWLEIAAKHSNPARAAIARARCCDRLS